MKNYIMVLMIALPLLIAGCNTNGSGNSDPSKPESKGIVIEFSPEGDEVWKSKEYADPSCYNQDAEGNKLIADLATRSFYSIDKDNKVVWSFIGNNPENIVKTKEGNYLVVNQAGTESIQEVDKMGNVVWTYQNLMNPTKAIKLDNGNYLVVVRNENIAKEVNKNKELVWQVPKDLLMQPFCAQILSNGNYLFCDYDRHRIIEVGKDGKVVWEYAHGLNHPIGAVKLDNGWVAISDFDNNRVIFIDEKNEIKKEIKGLKIHSLHLLPNGNVGAAGIQE